MVDVSRDDGRIGDIGSNKSDAIVGRSRFKGDLGFIARVQPDAGLGNLVSDRLLLLKHSSS